MAGFLKFITVSCVICFFGLMNPCENFAQPIGIGSAQVEPKIYNRVLSSERGRYVLGQVSDSSDDIFMLDTETGRLWRISESGKVGIFLKTVPYRIESTKDEEYSVLPEAMTPSSGKR